MAPRTDVPGRCAGCKVQFMGRKRQRFCSNSCAGKLKGQVRATNLRRTFAARFWARAKGAPGECWLWSGTKSIHGGYGCVSQEGRKRGAHAVAWELANERPVPEGKIICHACDVPACCNPAHLWVGTDADNAADMVAKKRQAVAERNAQTKLTASQVLAIRERYRAGSVSMYELGKEYGVNVATVRDITTGRSWKHLAA